MKKEIKTKKDIAKKDINKKKVFCKQNIPNILVVIRIILAVFVVISLCLELFGCPGFTIYSIKDIFKKNPDGTHQPYCSISIYMLIAGILFVIASITDWLDGHLARKYNWVSDFGKFWDPIADKILVNSVVILFAVYGLIPYPIPVIMIARDTMVDANRMIAAKQDIVVAANIYGKLKTILQMVGLVFIFFLANCKDYVNHPAMYWGIQNLLMYFATIMSVVSGGVYFYQIAKARKAKKAEQGKVNE